VDAHEGEIEVSSSAEAGTEFVITLPAVARPVLPDSDT
jgi:signal transduction histidine kinase